MKNVFIYGAPGSGKTTLGKKLAKRFLLPFADLDYEITYASGGKSIPEIFESEGEEGFRKRELSSLSATNARMQQLNGGIISLGGGALLNDQARNIAETFGTVFMVDTPKEELMKRVSRQSGSRPLAAEKERFEKLLESRASHYASFPSSINTHFYIDSGDEPSDIFVGKGLLRNIGSFATLRFSQRQRCVLVADENTNPLYGDTVEKSLINAGFDVSRCVIPAGEATKDISTVSTIWNSFLKAGLGRNDFAVALGGGVTGDLTGFAAATWMRGMSWINIPTTLLSMVDASTGGKTGFDLPEAKNMVGAFHSPVFVIADIDTLTTLPERELKCGLAESVKHALISDPELLSVLPNCDASTVARSLAVKVKIVTEDAREKGCRAKLNLGHTVGHAIEIATNFKIKHGEAVAIGTVEEARMAVKLNLAPENWPDKVASYFNNVGLSTTMPDGLTIESLTDTMKLDKKRSGETIAFALPVAPGDVRLVPVKL